MSALPLKADEVLKRASAVGSYYGFAPFAALAAANKGHGARAPYPEGLVLDVLDENARDVAAFLKHVRDAGIVPGLQQPVFTWHTNAAPGRPAPREVVVQFHALGAGRSIADAVLIRALRALVGELSKDEPVVRINSMGDKETRGRFARELGSFFRKHGPALPADCVNCAKTDVFGAAEMMIGRESGETLPSPTDHLSEASRRHFEDVLEYLEATETPYELAPSLLSRGGAWSDTCFEIRAEGIQAWGSRYHELAKPFWKGPVPSVGAVLRVAVAVPAVKTLVPAVKAGSKPRFVFVHIGDDAKRESMKMADTLRRARVPLAQAIGIESLTEQMRLAESLNPPYLLIMGRKEALERSVILRERATHAETSIPLSALVDRLKEVA
jgi:histidyl-tRNA synthetase